MTMVIKTPFASAVLISVLASLMLVSPARSSIMGANNLMDPDAYLTEEEQDRYSGVGRIECPVPGYNGLYTTTGWFAEGPDTIVSASHAFYVKMDGGFIRVIPEACQFATYDRFGSARDRIRIVRSWVKWEDARFLGDDSHDLSVSKLERKPNHTIRWLPLADNQGGNGVPITLVGFGNNLSDPLRPRKSRGMMYYAPPNAVNTNGRYRLSDNRRICATSVDSTHGFSGGMYVNSTGRIVCIHTGSISVDGKGNPAPFNLSRRNYNMGNWIDREFFNVIKAMALSKS